MIFEDRWEAQLAELIEFHQDSGVAEVLFLEQSHQMLASPWPLDKHRRMAAIYAKMASVLRKHGVGVGVNIASIVGHSDADVPSHLKLPFQKVVDDELKEAHACYCILDTKWQDYASEVCSIYADAVKPNRLFIDDDFRPLNHRRFMGCFCPLHAAAVSAVFGQKVDPSKLLSHFKGNSPVDFQVRRYWQDVHAEAEIAVVSRLKNAVASVSPDTQFGLMANVEQSHSMTGRQIKRLLAAMKSPNNRPLCRPGGSFYADSNLIQDKLFWHAHFLGLSVSQMSTDTEIVSEIEGYPHTRFLRSLKVLETELFMHAICGAEKFTLNLFDYVASPMRLEPGYGKLLRALRPDLEKIVALRKDKVPCGLAIPWKSDMAAHISYVPGPGEKNPGGIYPDRSACELMTQLGIPIQYQTGQCNVLQREEPRAFSDEEIRRMLSGGLLLDSTAAMELQKRGFGDFLGCQIESLPHNAAILERLDDADFAGPFVGTFCNTKWMSLPPRSAIHKLIPNGGKVISQFVGFELEEVSPGTICYENSIGGRIVVFGAPVNPNTWQFTNRAYWIRQLVRWASRESVPVMIEDAVNVGPFYFEDTKTGEGLLAVVSSSLDEQPLKIRTSLKLTPIDLSFCGKAKDSIEPLGIRLYSSRKL